MLFPFGDVDFVLLNIGRVRNVATFLNCHYYTIKKK